jgi:hypothetical protein
MVSGVKSNHAQSRFWQNRRSSNHAATPVPNQSRGNHGNHVFRETAGQAITLTATAITPQAITNPPGTK